MRRARKKIGQESHKSGGTSEYAQMPKNRGEKRGRRREENAPGSGGEPDNPSKVTQIQEA